MRNELVEFLVEEPSMKNFLNVILPKILPEGYHLNNNCFIRDHQGKTHLQKEIPIKVRAYQFYSVPVKVIIIHDQHSSECKELKITLEELVNINSNLPFLVRIVCRELEAWYLGDMEAIEKAYPNFKASRYKKWAKFRNPDLCNAAYEIKQLIPNFQKGMASKEISKHLNLDHNNSKSFNIFISGIKKFLN